jgi:hypothetical protein
MQKIRTHQKRGLQKGLAVFGLLLLLSAALSCSSTKSLQKLRRALQTPPPPTLREPLPERYRDVRGAIHVQSYLSHDNEGRPEEILEAAAEAKLDFIIMTDHTNPKSSPRDWKADMTTL